MGARIGRGPGNEPGSEPGDGLGRVRAADEGRELALDLTPSEVVLHEGDAHRGWRRFAGVALDDPEFLEVLGLLRAEAESALGAGRPVRLWLPDEQVLALSVRIDEGEPRARLRAAFRQAARATGEAPEELAVALGPAGPEGEAPLLVTHAATWREARDYAARWGFVPGPVSTRHHAEGFGPSGPEFRLESEAEEDAGSGRPDAAGARAIAWLAMAVAAALFWAPAGPAAASGAPAAAPLPVARGGPATPDTAGPAADLAAIAPPARPEDPEPGSEPDPDAADAPGWARAPGETPGAGAAVAFSGGPAAPLPPPRPQRAAKAPAASAPSRSTSPPAVASAGAVFLPPVRPPGLAARYPRIDRVALLGILNLDTGRKALVRLPDGDFVTLRAGEAVYGWEVREIGTDAMEVRRGPESRTLVLVSR